MYPEDNMGIKEAPKVFQGTQSDWYRANSLVDALIMADVDYAVMHLDSFSVTFENMAEVGHFAVEVAPAVESYPALLRDSAPAR